MKRLIEATDLTERGRMHEEDDDAGYLAARPALLLMLVERGEVARDERPVSLVSETVGR